MSGSDRSPPARSRGARRVLVAGVLGATALGLGAALIASPEDAWIALLIAAAVGAIELVWARSYLRGVQRTDAGVAAALSGPIVAGLVVIVASFSASLVVSQFRIAGTEARARDILSNTIPSVEHLSAARTALRQLGTLVDDFRFAPSSLTALRGELGAARARLDASLAAYEALPPIPQEPEHVAEIARELARADEAIERVLAGAGEPPETQRAAHEALHARIARTDDAITQLTLLNNTFAETSAEAVVAHRRASTAAAGLFGAISVVVAALAGLLAIGRMRARARLVDERDQLLAARATELEAFAGRVAHDLRNPLATLALRAASLQHRNQREPKLRDELGKLVRQTERMTEIIEDLLAFASAGARPRQGAFADLHTIMDEVLADFRPACEAIHAELRVDAFSAIQVACTPATLTCVLSNLVGNAVKFLGDGDQPLDWVAIHVIARGDVARIEVEDTGPGLPPDAEQRVFEPFQRLGASKPGIGLGLATVKKLVEAYHGRVGVSSAPGKGSTFWFELPVAAASDPDAPPPARDAEHPGSN